jgi:hypothetical protein
MPRTTLLIAMLSASLGLGIGSAHAQRITLGKNTCVFVLKGVPHCPRGNLPVCTQSVPCTLFGHPARVCRNYACIPRVIVQQHLNRRSR